MAKSKAVEKKKYTRMDFTSDQSVRWCPGCGDYAILSQVQKVENLVSLRRCWHCRQTYHQIVSSRR